MKRKPIDGTQGMKLDMIYDIALRALQAHATQELQEPEYPYQLSDDLPGSY